MSDIGVIRCEWAGTESLYIAYHDNEWGVPVHDDRELFEMLILEGAQAGLLSSRSVRITARLLTILSRK